MNKTCDSIEKTVEENINLIHSIIKRYTGRGIEYDDLFQIGSIGLINAAKRFNPSLGYQFSTYASSLIIGEIKRFFRDDGIIKVSRYLKEIAMVVNRCRGEFVNKNGREPTLSELSEICGFSSEEITSSMEATREVHSIDSETSEGLSIKDTFPSDTNEGEKALNRVLIESCLKRLSERDSTIIKYRYFLDKTQKETAQILGISQVQVSRIEKSALGKMRKGCG